MRAAAVNNQTKMAGISNYVQRIVYLQINQISHLWKPDEIMAGPIYLQRNYLTIIQVCSCILIIDFYTYALYKTGSMSFKNGFAIRIFKTYFLLQYFGVRIYLGKKVKDLFIINYIMSGGQSIYQINQTSHQTLSRTLKKCLVKGVS